MQDLFRFASPYLRSAMPLATPFLQHVSTLESPEAIFILCSSLFPPRPFATERYTFRKQIKQRIGRMRHQNTGSTILDGKHTLPTQRNKLIAYNNKVQVKRQRHTIRGINRPSDQRRKFYSLLQFSSCTRSRS